MTYKGRMEKRTKKRKKRFIIIFPLLLILLSGLVYGSYLTYKAMAAAEEARVELDRGDKSKLREEVVDPGKNNITILFLGIDDSESRGFGDKARTDAIMLATFNRKDKSVKMLSIPRDSYVYQPDRDEYDKINHAHAYHGIDGAVNTVEDLLEIPVDYYVRMNFRAFIEVVEALGGIEVDVPVDLNEMDSKDNEGAIRLRKGYQRIDGEEALALARTRKLDNDIERGKRQQLIVQGIINEAASVSSITKYGDVIDALGNNLTTNLTVGEMLALHKYATSGGKLNIESLNIEGYDDSSSGTYYYELDEASLEETSQTLKEHLELD
ncbi:LCP family protein [Sutcliffiella sp. NPDC057660]|uniref:LCP family protein n=1 Tax=Sutcliffiella sp. NPDC057660 TaxID=3346199 RepID=UPI00368199C6